MNTKTIEQEILIDVISNPGDTFYENVLSDLLDEQGIDHDFRKTLHNNFITELKPYQEKCFDIWANYWINVGLCTKSTDEDKAEQYFYYFYKELGFSTPKSIVWYNNPVEMCSQLRAWNQVRNQIWNRTWSQIRDQVKGQVWNQARDQVWNRVSNHIWDQVRSQVSNQIWSQARDQVRNQVLNQIWYGQQDAHWLAFFAYIMQVLRVEAPKTFIPYMLLAQEINWWVPAEQTVFVTRKPKEYVIKDNKFVKLVYQDGYTIT
jgi:hypothetical protein